VSQKVLPNIASFDEIEFLWQNASLFYWLPIIGRKAQILESQWNHSNNEKLLAAMGMIYDVDIQPKI